MTNLNDTTDALVWAKEFMKTLENPDVELDEEMMLSWFANAIMAGYDEARRKYEMVNAHDTLMKHVLGGEND